MRSPISLAGSPGPAPLPAPESAPIVDALPMLHGAEISAARRYADASRAASTKRACAGDWWRFASWCGSRGLMTLPADPRVVALSLVAEALTGRAPLTSAGGWQ